MSPEALTMESTHCVTRAEKPLPWRIARKAKQCVRITCDAQSLPGQGARKASKPLPLRIARKAEYVRITCDVQPLPCHGARKAPKSLPLRFARKAECVRITCDAQSLPCQEARKAPKPLPCRKARRAKCCTLTSMRLMAMLAMLMARSATRHVQYDEMSMRKPDWSEGIPTLPMNPTPTQIREWNARAALAVKAATGSDFLVKMKNGLTKSTNKETNMTQVVCHAQNDPGKEGYDLLQNVDEKHEVWMLHMVGVAIAAGAPIGGGDTIESYRKREGEKEKADGEGKKDKADEERLAKLRKAYSDLKFYMAGLDNQMYKAANDARPAVFNHANGHFLADETNPFLGIVVWHLITCGTTVRQAQKQLDTAKRRARKAAEAPLDRAIDVAPYIGNINEVVAAYYTAGGDQKSAAADVLPDVLRTLSAGLVAFGRPDTKEWHIIGAEADAFKKKWDNTGNLYWEPVYQKLMETYNEVFEDIDMAGKGKVANGPGTYSSYKSMSVRFPTGVAFGSIDEDDESNDIAAAFSQPATIQDYRSLMDAAPQVNVPERVTKSVTLEKKTEEGTPQSTRPIKALWRCGQKLDDGTTCGYRNFYYEHANRNDHTVKEKCDNCGLEKLKMLGSNDATTLAEEFKRSQDITNKALVVMTEQMAEITQSLKASSSQPTTDGFGLTAMASAGINVPDFTGSIFDAKPDLGMAHLLADSENHGTHDDVHTMVEGRDRKSNYVTTALVVVMILMALAACDACALSAALV